MQLNSDREDAPGFDWRRAQDAIIRQRPNRGTIDAGLLASYTPSSFFVEKINSILDDKSCVPGSDSPLKVIIVVSHPMPLSNEKAIKQVIPQNPDSSRFFSPLNGEWNAARRRVYLNAIRRDACAPRRNCGPGNCTLRNKSPGVFHLIPVPGYGPDLPCGNG
jgi:hypothetical protein